MRYALRTIVLLAFTASLCSGHEGDRVVPVLEIPDRLLSGIDIHDGDIEDWLDVIGEPSLTGLDLIPDTFFGEDYNPSNFDFRIWLGWNRGLNRVYIAVQGIDDVPVYQGNVGDQEWYWDSIILFAG